MIKNSWKTITLICGAHGDDYSHEMQLKQGPHSLFYTRSRVDPFMTKTIPKNPVITGLP